MSIDDQPTEQGITQPPPPVPPAVSIGLPSNPVAGIPTTISLFVDRGTSWRLKPPNTWEAVPAVSFKELVLSIPGLTEIRDHRSSVNNGRSDYSVTFPGPGTCQVSGWGITTGDSQVNAPGPRNITVNAPGPPAFSLAQPGNSQVVDVGPGGGQVTVDLTSGGDQVYPWTVAITCDGMTTSEQYSGTHYAKSVHIAPTPLGPRPITVKCTDPRGQSTTQTRSITVHDGAPPTVTLDPFPNPQTVGGLPFDFVVTGRTPGAQSGVTKVEYSVVNGPSGVAQNTAPSGDWSTWKATVSLPTTGTYSFNVTATDTRGSTSSVMSSITLQL
ncbi:hypothetical protein ACGFNU_00175 [Spirillospora sp. NPDC048911]|uniref:hypothetical protein n=1 Tax=Spirillospora sp. NPDC048911 TaxID=3364527 RepID=UPI0037244880